MHNSSPYFGHDAFCIMLNTDWTPLLKSAMRTHKHSLFSKGISYTFIMNPNYCISFWCAGTTYMSQTVWQLFMQVRNIGIVKPHACHTIDIIGMASAIPAHCVPAPPFKQACITIMCNNNTAVKLLAWTNVRCSY